jgi:hypothetical protein
MRWGEPAPSTVRRAALRLGRLHGTDFEGRRRYIVHLAEEWPLLLARALILERQLRRRGHRF